MSDSTENPVGSPAEENPQPTPASEQTAPTERLAHPAPEQSAPAPWSQPAASGQPAVSGQPTSPTATPQSGAPVPPLPPHQSTGSSQPTPPLNQGQQPNPTQPTTPLHQGQQANPTQPTTPLHQAPAQPTMPLGQGQAPQPPYGQTAGYPRPTTPYGAPSYGQQPYAAQPQGRSDYGQGSFGTPGQPQYAAPRDPAFNSAAYAASGAHTSSQRPERKRRGGVALIAALAIGAVIGGASGAGISVWAISANQGNGTNTASSPTSITVNDPQNTDWVTAVAQKASPSVVTISASSGSSGGTGSGVILSADGYVVTNTHVVTLDGAAANATLRVTADDGKIYDASIVGTDPVNDLAVIKLKDASGLTPIEFADSSKLNVGDDVVAIGAPLGYSGTVTNGIVSALNRSITVASSAAPADPETPNQGEGDGGSGDSGGNGGSGGSPFDFWNFDFPGQQTPDQQGSQSGSSAASETIALSVIQTDASINPGNSGGALLDDQGRLIGINVAIASSTGQSANGGQAGSVGVGFSIPSETVKRITDEIIKDGKATHGLLGAGVADASQAADATTTGALINSVTDGGAAQKAGLQVGDVVTAFNGIQVQDYIDLTALVRAQAAGATVKITYLRDGQSKTVDVTLGSFQS
ncbi:trypsin-like peptidase domain-containing protein [Cnuibacter sp. UC19_7]|uniref:S1C family serine protease n=1 Tax=Cnuibacter sp. UC19_7 TaxID=3350166 RepID=UPI00366E6E9F